MEQENDDVIFDVSGLEDKIDGMSEEDLEATESRADSKVQKIKKELESCKKERQEYMDGWQRSKADYVNALKRASEEREGAKIDGVRRTVGALLPAYDALERAKEHGEVPEGFQGIMKHLEGAFMALGVSQMGEVGESFDPMRHEALGQDPTDDKAKDDTVTAVLEKGYRMGESILRPARVRVAHFEG